MNIGEILSDKDYSNSHSNRNNNFNFNSNSNRGEEDAIINSYSDIIDPDYKLWFVKRLKAVGKDKFVDAGDKARRYGNNKSRLFAHLIS